MQRLQQAIGRQALALQGSSLGIQPEQALVLETIGPIENFVRAVREIDGLEWLGESELGEIEPEYGFYDERKPDKPLRGYLFLIMTDQGALSELGNLFDRWKKDRSVRFPSRLAPLRHAFDHLHTIRPWGPDDRLRETGLIEDWKTRLEVGQQAVPFEAELWFRASADRRSQAYQYAREVIESVGGNIAQQCVIPEIRYHGLLGQVPRKMASAIMARRDVRLLRCGDVWYLRPVGQLALPVVEDLSGLGEFTPGPPPGTPDGEPVAALLDGMPLAGHHLLEGRLVVDDPDDYQSSYQARERLHGTAMASLICHGDLSEGGVPLTARLYVRPILQPYRGFTNQPIEQIPESVLPVDLLHRAVRRLFESEGGEPPVAPKVRVINLSVCDRLRPFDCDMSPLGRLLDWLSWKYNVLFIVSAGNHLHELELAVARPDLRDMSAADLERAVIKALAADTRHRRLLSPAETLNGLTIGATHADGCTAPSSPSLMDPFATGGLPSAISAHGPGYRRAIKPEVFLPGGRQFLREKLGTAHAQATLQVAGGAAPPGQQAATPGAAGEVNRTSYSRGTSNAAALGTRSAAILLDVLEAMRSRRGADLSRDYDAVLLKAMLVHGAGWAAAGPVYESTLGPSRDKRTLTGYLGRFLGYGAANVARVVACTDQRVTVVGVGKLDDGQAQEFELPLPPSLSAVTEWRRLAITLSWFSPIESARHAYRVAHLWFDPKNDLAPERTNADHRAVTRGTVQHEVLEGKAAVDFQEGDRLLIKVNCRADAGDIPRPVLYALLVTLEVAEDVSIPIYEEVRARLHIKVPVTGGPTS